MSEVKNKAQETMNFNVALALAVANPPYGRCGIGRKVETVFTDRVINDVCEFLNYKPVTVWRQIRKNENFRFEQIGDAEYVFVNR